jgi:hypothetical protein
MKIIYESHWENMNSNELTEFKQSIFDHFRTVGFPYFPKPDIDTEISKIKKYLSNNTIITDKIIKQTMHGLNICWYYFPHSWEVKCGNMFSPMETFLDDVRFRKVIDKRMKFDTYISDGGMRKQLRIHTGTQSVSNFRPTSAYAIYEYFGGGTVYDMSSGYGGRMLGAYLSDKVKKYIGVDPCKETFDGLNLLKNDLNYKNCELYNIGSENFLPEENSLDLCFTSPPYFDTERYSNEDTQSWKKYPTKDLWLNDFLFTTVKNCIHGLKSGGHIAINISNVKSYPNLQTDFMDMMNRFHEIDYKETLMYTLSAINKGGFKFEPIYVFTKF